MNLNMLTLLLLAGAINGPPEPEPQPKLPADPEREEALLSPPHVLPDEPTTYQLDTAIRHARRQARDIDAYIVGHEADRVDELRAHYRVLLGAVRRVEARLREAEGEAKRAASPPESRTGSSAPSIDSSQTATRPTLPRRTRPPEPAAVKVRCPRCQAKPGRRCRGRSGTTMSSPHPERVRAWERQKG